MIIKNNKMMVVHQFKVICSTETCHYQHSPHQKEKKMIFLFNYRKCESPLEIDAK